MELPNPAIKQVLEARWVSVGYADSLPYLPMGVKLKTVMPSQAYQ